MLEPNGDPCHPMILAATFNRYYPTGVVNGRDAMTYLKASLYIYDNHAHKFQFPRAV